MIPRQRKGEVEAECEPMTLDRIEQATGAKLEATEAYGKLKLGVGHPLKTIDGINAVNELLALIMRLVEDLSNVPEGWTALLQRAEQAEAEVERHYDLLTVERNRVAKLEADLAAMTKERDEARELTDFYDSALRSACRKWAACCDSSVMYPPRIRVAGDGWAVVWDEILARYQPATDPEAGE